MAISNGTDEEFEACEADIRSRIPELSATLLEERRQLFLALLPQDSPNVEHLSLATTMFDCMRCKKSGMRIEKALSHGCRRNRSKELKSMRPSARVIFEYEPTNSAWGPGAEFKYSKHLSNLVREVVLKCGEDPDSITTKEMNKKHHRFACFHSTRGVTRVTVLSWFEAVSFRVCGPE